MFAFEYHRPKTLDEAVQTLRRLKEPKILAGGMTLIPTLKQRLARPSDLVDLRAIPRLSGVSEQGRTIEIGAMTTHADVAASDLVRQHLPGLAHLASVIADAQVRNRGTIGGSIANNDPSADYPAGMIGLAATIVTNKRKIAADDFFTGMFETALAPHEIIVAVRIERPKRSAYCKFKSPVSGYAIAGAFVAETGKGPRVAITGAGPRVFRVSEMEQALARQFSPAALANIVIPDSGLNADMHASAAYRAQLAKVMATRAVAACA